MTRIHALALGAALLVPATVSAQSRTPMPATAATTPTVGAAITDSAGVSLGTVDSITADAIVINTGTAKVAVPPASVGKTATGFALSITKEQLMAAQSQAQAQAGAAVKAKLVAGTSVNGLNGATLGTIKSSDATTVTMTTTKNIDVKLPVTGFGAGPNGGVVLGMTQAQLDAATAGATPNATPAPTATAGAMTTDAAAAAGTGTAAMAATTDATASTDAATTTTAPVATTTTAKSTVAKKTTKRTKR